MSMPTPGSLKALMDALVPLEQVAATAIGTQLTTGSQVRVYRWQPRSVQVPAIFNWIATAPFEQRDQVRYRDNVQVLARCAIAHTDSDEEMADIEVLADVLRDIIDTEFNKQQPNPPLGGTVTRALRQGMRTAVWDIGGAQLLGMELPLLFWLDRQLSLTG